MTPPTAPKKPEHIGPYAFFLIDQLGTLTRPYLWLTVPAFMLVGWSIGDAIQGQFTDTSAALVVVAVLACAFNRRANLRRRKREESRDL